MLFIAVDSGSGSNTGWLWSDTFIPAGQVMTLPALEHLPENLGTTVFEAVIVELKG